MRGRIEDFGLADILQLVVTNQKSGVLTLDNSEDEIAVKIQEGWIIDAEKSFRPMGAELAPRLLRAGLLNHRQVGAALKTRAETGKDMGTILCEMEYVSQETVSHFATLQLRDTVLDLFTWKTGTYDFEEAPPEEHDPWAEPLNIEQVLIQGIRIADEWPQVCSRIPSFSFVVEQRRPLPITQDIEPDQLFASGDEFRAFEEPSGFDDNEYSIHELATPGIVLQSIIDRAPVDRFETCRCLSNLIGSGYLTITPPSPA